MKYMHRRLRLFTAAALCAALLATLCAGCGSGGNAYSNTAAASSSAAVTRGADSAAPQAADMVVAESEEAGGALPPSLSMPESAGRKIIWRVNMSLETLDFDSAIGGLTEALRQAGGYIESSSVSGQSLEGRGSGRRFGSITARVPQEKLDDFLGAVSSVCNVVSTDRESEDVTLQYTDIETRKRSLEVEQERLLELLGQADNIDTIVALESRLSEIRYQLDGYSSSLRTYDSLVDYSTVYMDVREVLRVSEPAPQTLTERMGSGLRQTGRDISEGVQDLLVWVVVNLPYLIIWAAIIAVVVLVLRRSAKKRAAVRAARPAPGPAAPGAAPSRNPYQADAYGANPYRAAAGEQPEKPEEEKPE